MFYYNWKLSETDFLKNKGTVFTCFACGGGSTMGYKLAGFDVIGCNEIDPKMMAVYKANHNPKYAYMEGIQDFKNRKDLSTALYNLDILDGSPPCSSFSMAGNREKDWGKEKKFREGQKKQVLDTLFFDFIDLAKKLQPKIVICENVKGLLQGTAKKYLAKIYKGFDQAGYKVTHRLLDSSRMLVPQRRERVFLFAIRKDLSDKVGYADLFDNEPLLNMFFYHCVIPYKEIRQKTGNNSAFIKQNSCLFKYWKETKPGFSFSSVHPKGSYFNEVKNHPDRPVFTIRGSGLSYDYIEPRTLFEKETILAGTFPQDYNFLNNKPGYIIGMSVPPVMMAQIAQRIYEKWLIKLI